MTTTTTIDLTSDQYASEIFGTKEIRWYQLAARTQVEQILASEKNPRIMVTLPTGSGKTLTNGTILMSKSVRDSVVKDKNQPLRVLFVSHKHRLLTQAEQAYAAESSIKTVTQDNIAHSHMCNESKFVPTEKPAVEIYYHSIFTDIPKNLQFDMVIFDEGHHESCATFQYHLEQLGEFPIIFLSATPDRADGMLCKVDHIVAPISREQAVQEGYLAPTKIHSFVDSPFKDKVGILTEILTDYGDQMGQTMIFVRTKKEVTAIEKVIKNLGYAAVGILEQSEKELDALLNSFSDKRVQFLVNCNKINEGVDVAGCTDVILGRQFGSYPQLNQVIGRAARPDSECNVWELVNPLNGNNLDTTVVVGTPESHRLINKERGQWVERTFDYVTNKSHRTIGIADGIRIRAA